MRKLFVVPALVVALGGCIKPQAYDAATVSNFKKVQEWQAVDEKKDREILDKYNASDVEKKSAEVRHDALRTMLDTAVKAEEAKKPRE